MHWPHAFVCVHNRGGIPNLRYIFPLGPFRPLKDLSSDKISIYLGPCTLGYEIVEWYEGTVWLGTVCSIVLISFVYESVACVAQWISLTSVSVRRQCDWISFFIFFISFIWLHTLKFNKSKFVSKFLVSWLYFSLGRKMCTYLSKLW